MKTDCDHLQQGGQLRHRAEKKEQDMREHDLTCPKIKEREAKLISLLETKA